jgi:hypothetical protein
MKELNNTRMNPWIDIPNEHVNQSDIDEVFDPLKQPSYKNTNPFLHIDTKRHLVKLCWKIYSTFVVTNNDFASWVVKGCIAEEKDHDVN